MKAQKHSSRFCREEIVSLKNSPIAWTVSDKNRAIGVRRAVDDMKPSDRSLPVILVGGGALLVTGELDCAPRLIRPPHADVANAVGAAIAQVGGEAERIVSYRAAPREQAIAEVKARAVDVAVKAGALRETVSIVDIDETDLAYMEPGTKRLRIRAVGEISLPGETGSGSEGKS